jgi:RimJ/RimL family protein N-acetyltransferase
MMAHEPTLPEPGEPPVLSLGAFRLRPLRADDAVQWSAYLSDPRVTLHTSWGSTDFGTIDSLVQRLRADYATKASWRWAIARDEDDCLVGVCGFSTWSTVHRAAELVYDLSPRYWSRGIATRSVQAALDWGFSCARLNRVQAVVLPSNVPSIAVLDRCGFTQEGVLRHYRMVRGEPRDFLLYARLRSQPQHSLPNNSNYRGDL